MNKQTKNVAGVSMLSFILLMFHLLHLEDMFTTYQQPEEKFKNAPVYMISKDSAGKADTMLMEEYLKSNP